SLNVPPGLSVIYNNGGAFLSVVSPLPAQIIQPSFSAGCLSFSFGTIQGRTYAVESVDILGAPGWTSVTNVIGNGALMEVTVPLGAAPQRFFRVSMPEASD
ncbi:MAG TPA: hypothetical protein VEC99_19280, partial [Clostridia bacterium]|nr:hypothetical protein [Clostridia bacterium]